ncbi:MAG: hypothetical protein QG578_2200 [Thermodesulfobacteriota bacterium]|nr:hypothetical protein [Thermodesulfobacteriota bacterium]
MMEEEAKKGRAPSGKDSLDDPDLMNLLEEVKSALDDDDEIIELTEVIDGAEGAELSSGNRPPESESVGDSDIIIKDLNDDLGIDDYVKDDFAASLGMKIETDPEFSVNQPNPDEPKPGEPERDELKHDEPDPGAGEAAESGKITVSPRQIEEAIERVVNKMLGDKIDAILAKTIERAVSQEIIRLKNILRVSNEEETD